MALHPLSSQSVTGLFSILRTAYGSAAEALARLRGNDALPALVAQAVAHEVNGDGCQAATAPLLNAVRRWPNTPIIFLLLGRMKLVCGDVNGAFEALRQATVLDPNIPAAWILLGYVQKTAGALSTALQSYQRAAELAPQDASFYNDMGTTALDMGDLVTARKCFELAITNNRSYAEAYNNLGIVLGDLGLGQQALAAYEAAVHAEPKFAAAWFNMANCLAFGGHVGLGIDAYSQALLHDPSLLRARANRAFYRQHILDWRHREEDNAIISAAVQHGGPAVDGIQAFQTLMLPLSPRDQKRVAQHHAGRYLQRALAVAQPFSSWQPVGPVDGTGRLRIGYSSGDTGDHITARLMRSVFALHNRKKFEIVVYAHSPDDGSQTRQAIQAAADRFVNLADLDNAAAAKRIHEDGVAVLFELDGHTARNRMEIDALRPAPIQVMHIGFPGTTGASFMDLFVADRVIVPPSNRWQFTEHLLLLPYSYQANDHSRAYDVLPIAPTRAQLGLPSKTEGVVFCDFNQLYKVDEAVFDVWMKILHRVPRSVLWLLKNPKGAEQHVYELAALRGIDASRIVFTDQFKDPAVFVAAASACDIFLDTTVCNAHATAADVLWQGVPLVTLPGGVMTNRVAASLLTAMGAAELIATSMQDYEDIAVTLATVPTALRAMQQKLFRAAAESPAFNTTSHVQYMERGLEMAWDMRLWEKSHHYVVAK